MNKHTPGKWVADHDGEYPFVYAEVGDDAIGICRLSEDSDVGEINALLISAAPDLLRACKQALRLPALSLYAETDSSSHHHSERKAKEYYDQMNIVLRQINEAIAKAEEKTE